MSETGRFRPNVYLSVQYHNTFEDFCNDLLEFAQTSFAIECSKKSVSKRTFPIKLFLFMNIFCYLTRNFLPSLSTFLIFAPSFHPLSALFISSRSLPTPGYHIILLTSSSPNGSVTLSSLTGLFSSSTYFLQAILVQLFSTLANAMTTPQSILSHFVNISSALLLSLS